MSGVYNYLQELLLPAIEFVKWLQVLATWEDPLKSVIFCTIVCYIIYRYFKNLFSVVFGLLNLITYYLVFVCLFLVEDTRSY